MTYLDDLPEELIFEIFCQIDNKKDIFVLVELYPGVYDRHQKQIIKSFVCYKCPHIYNVIEDIYKLDSFDNMEILEKCETLVHEDILDLLKIPGMTPESIYLILRYKFFAKYPSLYNKIHKFIIPTSSAYTMMIWMTMIQDDICPHINYMRNGKINDNYIHQYNILPTDTFAIIIQFINKIIAWCIIQEPNFNFDIQDKETMQQMLKDVSEIDSQLYQQIIEKNK